VKGVKIMKPGFGLWRIAVAITAVLVASVSAVTQERKISRKDVPIAVINAFKAAYPTATIKGYAREKEHGKTFYEIESKDGSIGRDVLYNPDGTIAEIEETIAANDLPSAIQEAIRTKYPGAVVTKAEKTTVGEKVTYEVIARRGKKRLSMEFDADGHLTK
jgi:hypothetical protein